jgi:transcription antitermination factor NusG
MIAEAKDARNWYAVYTKSHFEKKVNELLVRKEIDTFLPMRRGKAKQGRTYRFTEVPLFRSYLFVRVPPNGAEMLDVLGTTGVSTIVKRGSKPSPVSASVIRSISKMVEYLNSEFRVITQIKRGERVRIVKGALSGSEGELIKIDNKRYAFVVNVDILGRGVKVIIPPEFVSKL